VLPRLPDAARHEAELNGRRSGRAAFDRVTKHGYSAADLAFREIGVTLLTRWVREGGVSDAVREVWLASALSQFDALIAGRGRESRDVVITIDLYGPLRDAVSGVIRRLGLMAAPSQLSPKNWEHVLDLVEARMRTRGVGLPDGWRGELAVQMGRVGADIEPNPET